MPATNIVRKALKVAKTEGLGAGLLAVEESARSPKQRE